MFNKLVASQGGRRGGWTPTTIGVSLAIHAVLLVGAVYATVAAPQEVDKEEELVTFVDIPEEAAPEPETPPPAPPPEAPPAATPPPQGFQELIPPLTPPPMIPDVDNSQPAVNPEDFSGLGQAGGVADGIEGGTPQPVTRDSTFAYEVGVLDRIPKLSNESSIASTMQRLYPRMLQDAGIGGTVQLQFEVLPNGRVDPATVKVLSSSHPQFAEVSSQVVERFRFRPGVYKGEEVRVLVTMPVAWKPSR